MPAKEIKALRQDGKLDEALEMGLSELNADPHNIWPKRNISWVYYEIAKQNNSIDQFETFIEQLNQIDKLDLPSDESMIADNIAWQVGIMVFAIAKEQPEAINKIWLLFEASKKLPFTKPSDGYSFLFKAFHKGFKDHADYLSFADWWSFENFSLEDYQKSQLPNGKNVMSIAEQAYIAYARHLLPNQSTAGVGVNPDTIKAFIPKLDKIIEFHPDYQYPPYFKAKLLLALGDKEHSLSALLPFARKKQNEFWVWQLLGETLKDDSEIEFACICKALSCNSPQEMLTKLRRILAAILIQKKLYNEAKTEIDLISKTCHEKGHKIPDEVIKWQESTWYPQASSSATNNSFYKQYFSKAESVLFQDVEEVFVIIDNVNKDKKVVNFIQDEDKFGFFKYSGNINRVKVGDVLKVRFESGKHQGMFKVYTTENCENDPFKIRFVKELIGNIRIPDGKNFGFVEDVFVPPYIVENKKWLDGTSIKGHAIKSFNKDKNQWGWKLMDETI